MMIDYIKVLDAILLSTIRRIALDWQLFFQQDNDPNHTSKSVTSWLQQKITVLPWPSMSPDLNPIKYLWSKYDIRIRSRVPKIIQELEQVAFEKWKNIPVKICSKSL